VAAREACDAEDALLVFDEVQAGMGRTGTLWAYEQAPVRPDVITAAKALGGGLPVGACIASAELGAPLELGDHGSTFAGAPIAASAALAALDVIGEPALLDKVRALGALLAAELGALDFVAEVRARGLMVGVTLAPGIDAVALARSCLGAGLVINVPGDRMLRFLPPLVIGEDDVQEAIEILRDAAG
jgi:acetylornithine/succinyldiaminopimelate/putrescine aminotransferase